jgi:hypothetical protein
MIAEFSKEYLHSDLRDARATMLAANRVNHVQPTRRPNFSPKGLRSDD